MTRSLLGLAVRDNTPVLLDDIAAAGKITTHFQTGVPTVIGADKQSAVLTGKNGALTLRVFGPVGIFVEPNGGAGR
jgi:hypothetical protein